MKREDRERDIRERQENYQRGLVALFEAVGQFTKLTGVDLTGDVDISGRRMGEAPYLKITAERLVEIVAQLESGIWQSECPTLATVPSEAVVLQFDRRVHS